MSIYHYGGFLIKELEFEFLKAFIKLNLHHIEY